jgi:outer membrane protein TolC
VIAFALWFIASAQAASPVRAGFAEALDKIVQRSPAVARQREVIESTRSKYLSTGLLLWAPSVSAKARYGRDQEFGAPSSATNQSIEGVAELNLFRFGADLAATKAANRDIESQELTLNDAVLDAEAEGVAALVSYIQAQRQLEVTGRILATRKDSLSVARRRYDKGQLPSEEVDKVSVDLDNAAAQKRDAESQLAQASAELERLLGEPDITTEWPWKEAISKAVPVLLKHSSSDLAARPDWKASAAQVELAHQRSKEAFGAMLPRLDAKASYGYFSNDMLGVKTTGPGWTAGLEVTVPLFDRLTGYGTYRALAHAKGAAEADLEAVKRLAKKEWDAAKASLSISLDTALAREKTLTVARKLYQANQERFNRGILSANEFRIDQDRLYQTELFVLEGWGAVHNDFRRLCHSLGRRVESCLGER